MAKGFNLITGGTDNHLLLVDVTGKNVTGKVFAQALDRANIVLNYNSIPFDPRKPFDPSGVRIGTPAFRGRTQQVITISTQRQSVMANLAMMQSIKNSSDAKRRMRKFMAEIGQMHARQTEPILASDVEDVVEDAWNLEGMASLGAVHDGSLMPTLGLTAHVFSNADLKEFKSVFKENFRNDLRIKEAAAPKARFLDAKLKKLTLQAIGVAAKKRALKSAPVAAAQVESTVKDAWEKYRVKLLETFGARGYKFRKSEPKQFERLFNETFRKSLRISRK